MSLACKRTLVKKNALETSFWAETLKSQCQLVWSWTCQSHSECFHENWGTWGNLEKTQHLWSVFVMKNWMFWVTFSSLSVTGYMKHFHINQSQLSRIETKNTVHIETISLNQKYVSYFARKQTFLQGSQEQTEKLITVISNHDLTVILFILQSWC